MATSFKSLKKKKSCPKTTEHIAFRIITIILLQTFLYFNAQTILPHLVIVALLSSSKYSGTKGKFNNDVWSIVFLFHVFLFHVIQSSTFVHNSQFICLLHVLPPKSLFSFSLTSYYSAHTPSLYRHLDSLLT